MIGDILQPTHLIFILVVALLVLGPKRLPEVGRSLGRGIRDFRGALSGLDEDHSPPPPVAPVTPATTSESPTTGMVEDAAHGYVPVSEATAAAPTPVADAETVAVDSASVATASAESATSAGASDPAAEPRPASATVAHQD